MKLRGPKAHPNRPQKTMVCPTWAASAHLSQVDSHLTGLTKSRNLPAHPPGTSDSRSVPAWVIILTSGRVRRAFCQVVASATVE
jgi:hypothetical protein